MSDAVIFALHGTVVGSTAGGPTPASGFELPGAFVETLLLLTSSLTFGVSFLAMEGHDLATA